MATSPTETSQLGKIAAYIEILAKDPRSTVFVPLAETYRQAGLLDDALDVATKGVQNLSNFSPGFTVLGRVQAQRGDLESAVRAFEKALLLEPDSLTAVKGLAKIRLQQGNPSQAMKLAQRALALQPDDAVALKMLASLRTTQEDATNGGRSEPAVSSAREGIPTADPISTATIAEIYIRQGFLNRALKVYRDLLQVDPHNEDIRQKLVALKQRMEGQGVAPGPEMADTGGSTGPDTDPSAAPSVPDLLPVADPETDATTRQLEKLEGWIEAIRRRRSNVR